MDFIKDNGYRLVWNDEFDGRTLDASKWGYAAKMSGAADMLLKDSEVTDVRGGSLFLTAREYKDEENPEIKYAVNYSVTTLNTMSFIYGYAEMRARVPFKHGAWPSLWMSTNGALGGDRELDYSTEVDIFEAFSSTCEAVPNIHKWYFKGEHKGEHHQFNGWGGGRSKSYIFRDNQTALDWHLYGFEWTPEFMRMSIDGDFYMRYDLSENFDGMSDMKGFHKPMYFIINNHLFTEKLFWVPSRDSIVKPEDLPSVYEIDYIRLYQKPGQGVLNTGD